MGGMHTGRHGTGLGMVLMLKGCRLFMVLIHEEYRIIGKMREDVIYV